MSIFSMMKKGRQAAKEHNAKKNEKQAKEQQTPPYKHIPKHAAIDALSGGPASWREVDRPRILEQNRRRSAMTASGLGMSGVMTPVHSGMMVPRVHSSLSHVSYPSSYASPMVQVPRAYSYSSMPSGWASGSEMTYIQVDMAGSSLKGKEVERLMVDSGRASRSSSRISTGRVPLEINANGSSRGSPVDSSSDSTSSQDDLEIKVVKSTAAPASRPSSGMATPTKPMSDTDSVHRLHPSGHSRKVSDPNQYVSSRTSYVPSRSSPTRGGNSSSSLTAAGIPPVPALPPMQFGTALSSSVATHSPTPSISGSTGAVMAMPTISMAPKRMSQQARLSVAEEEVSDLSDDEDSTAMPVGMAVTAPVAAPAPVAPHQRSPRSNAAKPIRVPELQTIESNISLPQGERPTPIERRFSHLPTTFDEASLPAPLQLDIPPPVQPQPKQGKLSKSGGGSKLSKKNRWSLRSSKTAAVAG